jgi:predicted GNAT superfamily acetyltransferase
VLKMAMSARASEVTISLVDSEPEARDAVQALAQIWPRQDGKEPLPPELAWVFAHSGNYVAIARAGSDTVGAAIGFRGEDEDGIHLHSHIAGVLPQWQGSNVGYQLKQHQRSWAMRRGIDRITWTFDPLVARNAYFNVVKLGAHLTRYYVDFYGPMDDGINDGDETDRCLATWRLSGPAALAAAAGEFMPADLGHHRAAGAVEVLTRSESGAPSLSSSSAPVRLLQLPRDIVEMRGADAPLAREWRLALRRALTDAFRDGLEVVGVSRDSCYVVARPGG